MSNVNKIIPVILCGGSGTRLWPISDKQFPKQFHSLIGQESLLHQTLERAVTCTGCTPSEIITITSDDLKTETLEQLNEFNKNAAKHLIIEPCARNTAPAIANASLYAQKNFGEDAVLWIMPSDHYIQDTKKLKDIINTAVKPANNGNIVTLGIKPDRPETGYGYIKSGKELAEYINILSVDEFVEKPNHNTAQKFLNNGNYFWNSGMFIATAGTLIENFLKLSPDIITPYKKKFR